MDSLAYLHLAEWQEAEVRQPLSQHRFWQRWQQGAALLRSIGAVALPGRATSLLLGVATAAWVLSLADVASAVTLFRGDQGAEVRSLQTLLSNAGYLSPNNITGFYGPLTEAAVRRFQADQGLVSDGIAGDRTFASLRQDFQPIRPDPAPVPALLQFGSSGAEVTLLQQRLSAQGYYQGPITGFFGEQTQAAVRRFQADQGLAIDGIVGRQTLAALTDEFRPVRPAPTPPSSTATLRPGDSGRSVLSLQYALYDTGFFGGPFTGFYGTATESAVRRFQTSRGLRNSGIAGPETLDPLGLGDVEAG